MPTKIHDTSSIEPVGPKYVAGPVLARRLGYCRKTLTRWSDNGYFSSFKPNGKTVLFDENEVHRYIESTRMSPTPRATAVRRVGNRM